MLDHKLIFMCSFTAAHHQPRALTVSQCALFSSPQRSSPQKLFIPTIHWTIGLLLRDPDLLPSNLSGPLRHGWKRNRSINRSVHFFWQRVAQVHWPVASLNRTQQLRQSTPAKAEYSTFSAIGVCWKRKHPPADDGAVFHAPEKFIFSLARLRQHLP